MTFVPSILTRFNSSFGETWLFMIHFQTSFKIIKRLLNFHQLLPTETSSEQCIHSQWIHSKHIFIYLFGCVSIGESSVGIEVKFVEFNRELDLRLHCSPWCLEHRMKVMLFLGEQFEELPTTMITQVPLFPSTSAKYCVPLFSSTSAKHRVSKDSLS